MKVKSAILLGCSLLTLAGAVTWSGCASERYHRSTGAYIDDASITARVKTDLLRDPVVAGTDVNVETYRGVVQLNGFVNSQEQIRAAEKIARNTEGVRSVTNNLRVKPEAAGAPAQQ